MFLYSDFVVEPCFPAATNKHSELCNANWLPFIAVKLHIFYAIRMMNDMNRVVDRLHVHEMIMFGLCAFNTHCYPYGVPCNDKKTRRKVTK